MPATTRATARALQTNANTDPTAGNAGTLRTATSAQTGLGTLPQTTNIDGDNEPDEAPVDDFLNSTLPRTESQGIGRFAIDASRVLETLHLDTTAPLNSSHDPLMSPHVMQQPASPDGETQDHRVTNAQPMTDPRQVTHRSMTHDRSMTSVQPITNNAHTHSHPTSHPPITNPDHRMQMVTTKYEALVAIMVLLGATEREAAKWAMYHVCGDETAAISTEGVSLINQALQRLPAMYPHLADSTEQQRPQI
jgi:hypothetical protein